jgi:hypothetical protein
MPLWTSLIRPAASATRWVTAKGYRLWRRPVLRIGFDESQTYDIRLVLDYGGSLGRFCHFIVYNDGRPGRAPAHNARARLMSVASLTAFGEPRPAAGFVAPRTLKWANELDPNPRDIEPDVPRRADLCYAIQGDPKVYFFAGPVDVGVQTVFLPGRYRVRVRVDADNALPAEGVFDVTHDGDWAAITIRPRSDWR